ncbi:MAG TPA: hypothetical protein VNK52_14330 [Hyphomicrobiaceae bacterium]|nr:hypothetical protein [Hyphomicrobiaceae bacterium]
MTEDRQTSGALAPANAVSAASDVDSELVADARRAIASGHVSTAEAGRWYGLTEAEVSQLSTAAPNPGTALTAIHAELAEIAKLRRSDPRKYWSDAVQTRERELIEIRDGHADIDPLLREEWARTGGIDLNRRKVEAAGRRALQELDAKDAAALEASVSDLPIGARREICRFLAVDPAGWRPASEEDVAEFRKSDIGDLVDEWGNAAAHKLGIVFGRMRLMAREMSAKDRSRAEAWFDGLNAAQAKAVFKALAGG